MDNDVPQYVPSEVESQHTQEKSTLASLDETQTRVVEEYQNASKFYQQLEVSQDIAAFGVAREGGLTEQDIAYARTIGEYLHAVGIQPGDAAFTGILQETYHTLNTVAPELAYITAFRQELLSSNLEGSLTDDFGMLTTSDGQRERFMLSTMETVGGRLILGGNYKGYRRYQPEEATALNFRIETTNTHNTRLAPRPQIQQART